MLIKTVYDDFQELYMLNLTVDMAEFSREQVPALLCQWLFLLPQTKWRAIDSTKSRRKPSKNLLSDLT